MSVSIINDLYQCLYIYIYIQYVYLVGGFNCSEKYESQMGLLFPIHGKKSCSKQQPTTYGIVWNIMGILDILEVAISSIYIYLYIYISIYLNIYISISIYLNIYISIIDDL